MTVVGEVALWVALFLAVLGSALSFVGGATGRPELVTSGVRAIPAAAAMTGFAAIGLWAALLTHDFSLEYVAAHTTINTPTLYLLTAFWGGAAGSMLSWAVAFSACAAAAVRGARRGSADALPWVAGTLGTILGLVLLAICFGTNPYSRVEWVPAEGRGLAPPLQNPLAAPHFIALYTAYAAAAVALTLAIGGLVARRFGAEWLRGLRFWSTLAWCLLTLGIALRMRWTYVEPALGDLVAADPAQAANLALWLVGAGLVGRFARQPGRRSGGATGARGAAGLYAVYAGAALVVLGSITTRFWAGGVLELRPGQARELTDPFTRRWRFISQGPSRDERLNYLSTGVALEAWRGTENAGIVSAERRQYLDSVQRPIAEPSVRPGIRSSLALDVYVILAEVRGDTARLRVTFRPLVSTLWIGWGLILAGGIAAGLRRTLERDAPGDARPVAAG